MRQDLLSSLTWVVGSLSVMMRFAKAPRRILLSLAASHKLRGQVGAPFLVTRQEWSALDDSQRPPEGLYLAAIVGKAGREGCHQVKDSQPGQKCHE